MSTSFGFKPMIPFLSDLSAGARDSFPGNLFLIILDDFSARTAPEQALSMNKDKAAFCGRTRQASPS